MTIPDLAPPNDPPSEEEIAKRKEIRRRLLLLRRAKDGINWFYWVAGLSIISTIISLTGSTPNYFLGLGIVQLIDINAIVVARGTSLAPLMGWVAAAMDLLVAGIFVFFGYRGHRNHRNWTVAGIVVYTLDGLIFLLSSVWLGVIVHAFIIYSLVRGLRAMDEVNRLGLLKPGDPASANPS